jgi:4-amino-4-deoxy-L-arabinose transferase-like glycosyltransferase
MIEAVVSAGQRVSTRRAPRPVLELQRTRNPGAEIFLWSRAAIWLAAVLAFAWFEPNRHPLADRWDTPRLHELGWAVDIWARWDSDFFLRIAEDGYDTASAAFFPLYPALVGVLGRMLFGHYVLAGIVVSLAAGLAAFPLLYRLAEQQLGTDGARRAVLYLAVFPMSLFLGAVYSESLFLLLSVAAFALAERRRFLAAGICCGLALLTRPFGLALLPALAVLAWRSPQRRESLAGLAAALPIAAVYPLVLWAQLGDPFAFADAQGRWHRHVSWAGPFGGIWAGVHDAVTGATPAGAGELHAAAVNWEGLVTLVLFGLLAVVAWKRLGAAYGLFAALSLALPLSVPSDRWPLLSLPRFVLPVFPFFLALAAIGRSPRTHAAILSVSAIFLGVAAVQWALWQWVA